MENIKQNKYSTEALLAEFFAQDDLKSLAADAGALLECPLLVLDDTFHVVAYYRPLGFSDPLFQASVSRGEITYEAGAIISRSEALTAGSGRLCQTGRKRISAPLCAADQFRRPTRLPDLCGHGWTSAKNPAGNMEYGRTGFGKAGVYRNQPAG